MSSSRIPELLRDGSFAEGEHARDELIAVARRQVQATSGVIRVRRWRRAIVIAVALLIVLGLASRTPPGQAATQWVSDLVAGPNTFEPGQYGFELKTSTLIAPGELSTGDRYQLRGYVGNGNDGGCVVLIWENSDRSLENCANVNPSWKEGQVSSPEIGRLPEDEKNPGASGTAVIGVAPADTTELALRVPASDGVPASDEPAQLFSLPGSISDTTGASAPIPPVKLFVGYLPPGAGDMRSAPPAEAVALSGDAELGAAKLRWIRFQPAPGGEPLMMSCTEGDHTCQTILKQGVSK